MKTITVQVREDHLENLARTKPMTALAELIWNALDAEATDVRVEFVENEMEGLEAIRIVDNGHGLHYDDALIVFQNLGGSWKRDGFRTHIRKRLLHGKYGKGRFRAFSMGTRVEWQTVYEEAGDCYTYSISGGAATLGQFVVSNSRMVENRTSGMVVEISNPRDNTGVLRGVKAMEEVTDMFALYMRQYPDVNIVYDGVPLDPSNSQAHYEEYDLHEMVMQNGERVTASLTVIEWNIPGKRGVFLCTQDGFMLHNALPRLHFRGFSYTAYLKSSHISILEEEGLLQAGDLSPDVRQLLDAARAKLREHFTLREAEHAQETLDEWKEHGLYPYADEPKDDAEANERRIFNIYATHLDQIFPDFSTSRPRNKRLVLRLVRELVHIEPTRVARLLDEMLDFPDAKEEEIMEIMKSQ